MKYKIVTADNLDQLERDVHVLLNSGWELVEGSGITVYYTHQAKFNYESSTLHFCRELVKS